MARGSCSHASVPVPRTDDHLEIDINESVEDNPPTADMNHKINSHTDSDSHNMTKVMKW